MVHRTLTRIRRRRFNTDEALAVLRARVQRTKDKIREAMDGGADAVSAQWVLDMLDGRPGPAVKPVTGPQADPLTGCLPVTAAPTGTGESRPSPSA